MALSLVGVSRRSQFCCWGPSFCVRTYLISHTSPELSSLPLSSHDLGITSLLNGIILLFLELLQLPIIIFLQLVIEALVPGQTDDGSGRLSSNHSNKTGLSAERSPGSRRAALAKSVEDAVEWVGKISVERSHLILCDSILESLYSSLLRDFSGITVCEGENVLRQRQQWPLHVLGVGTHDGGGRCRREFVIVLSAECDIGSCPEKSKTMALFAVERCC